MCMMMMAFGGAEGYPAHGPESRRSAMVRSGCGRVVQGGGRCVLRWGCRRVGAVLWECRCSRAVFSTFEKMEERWNERSTAKYPNKSVLA